jgi:hypothetical protein
MKDPKIPAPEPNVCFYDACEGRYVWSYSAELLETYAAAREAAARQEERETVAELRRLLARYSDETPLGHQPHMIAHLADKALGRAG